MTIYKAGNIELPADYVKTYTSETELRRLLKELKVKWTEAVIWEIPSSRFDLPPTLICLFEDREVIVAVKGT